MARCPSARPGVQRSGAEKPEGDRPGCTSVFARKLGETGFAGAALPLTDVRGQRPLAFFCVRDRYRMAETRGFAWLGKRSA